MIKKSMLGVVSAREMFCPDGSITTHTEKNKVRRTRPVDVILILADQKAKPFWGVKQRQYPLSYFKTLSAGPAYNLLNLGLLLWSLVPNNQVNFGHKMFVLDCNHSYLQPFITTSLNLPVSLQGKPTFKCKVNGTLECQ